MAAGDVPFWVQATTALTAIVAPIVTLIAANKNIEAILKIARSQAAGAVEVAQRQVHAGVVSANRQKWIDALRDDIANFLSESDSIRVRLSHGAMSAEEVRTAGKPMVLLFNRIRLRLNPDEEDHKQLISLMDLVLKKIDHSEASNRDEEIAKVGQLILKREWRRVKTGD